MKKCCVYIFQLFAASLLIASCNYNGNSGNQRPIILGDSATIVTETDSQNLKDFVTDLHPTESTTTESDTSAKTDTTSQQLASTSTPAQQQPQTKTPTPAPQAKEEKEKPVGSGLNVAFKDVTVYIPNIVTRSTHSQNPQRSNGATYEFVSGNLNGNQIKLSGSGTATVAQRYGTMVVIKNDLGVLPLENLTTTTNWQPLRGRNNNYVISGLEPSRLTYPKASPGAIRNAVIKAARRQRMSRRQEQEWVSSIRNVRTANQRPLITVLHNVEWKIQGRNAKGQQYQKQLRIDIP